MISNEEKLLIRLESCIRAGKTDPSSLKINYPLLIQYLNAFGYAVPYSSFSEYLEKALKEQVIGKLSISPGYTFIIAKYIKVLAEHFLDAVTRDIDVSNL
ncbi:MAG: hypothetical protein D6732_08235 [Methanobacteriota archaeon]|nr:MAG: hypothetical protein D6732_08235 [Euryarchaeota archaeon]